MFEESDEQQNSRALIIRTPEKRTPPQPPGNASASTSLGSSSAGRIGAQRLTLRRVQIPHFLRNQVPKSIVDMVFDP